MMFRLFTVTSLLLAICLMEVGCQSGKVFSDTTPVQHDLFDQLLQKHVSVDGSVDYQGFIRDTVVFNQYLELLQNHPPNTRKWSKNEQLAYWINAYNAFTIDLVLQHYPIKSIKDIQKGIPFVNSVWDLKFIKIGNQTYDLNQIEHSIIRAQFEEPRIHFAVNCASYSCPHLRNEAYTAARLEEQLEDQTRTFFNDARKNQILSADKVVVSMILKWYSTDFTNKGIFSRLFGGKGRSRRLINFINPYVEIDLSKNAKVEFMEYDWSLNE